MVKVYEERWYQEECSEAWAKDIIADEKCFPIVAVPTAGGKTVILSKTLKKYLKEYPDNEVLILSHTEDIVAQDAKTLQDFFPEKVIGVYNASLGRKEKEQITVGSIQSVYNNMDLFKWVNLIIIDEVHAVSHKNEGRYRGLIKRGMAQVAGMSATIFRMGHGYIHKGKDTIFNKLSYDLTSKQKFNRLVKEGYLCKMIAIDTELKLDSSNVKKSGGDYNIKHLSAAHNVDSKTRAAITEAIHYGKNYHKWLVFAIDIDHANAITRLLNINGVKAAALHSHTKKKKPKILEAFRSGNIKAIVSVGMITTGFDEPSVDLILMLRPTQSAVLHIQMLGRGLRTYTNPETGVKKDHTLVLDYADNCGTLGQINNVQIPKPKTSTKFKNENPPEPPTKTCPKCRTINSARATKCETCGHEFPRQVKLLTSASTSDIMDLSDDWKPETNEKWLKVQNVQYRINQRLGRPDILTLTYLCGLVTVKENWMLDHPGVAGNIGAHKARYRGFEGAPSVQAVFNAKNRLRVPKQILVDYSAQYPEIKNAVFD